MNGGGEQKRHYRSSGPTQYVSVASASGILRALRKLGLVSLADTVSQSALQGTCHVRKQHCMVLVPSTATTPCVECWLMPMMFK